MLINKNMGSSSSHPYEIIEKRFNESKYTIYSYQGSKFLLSSNVSKNSESMELKIFITELRPVVKEDEFIEKVYMDEDEKIYVELKDDITKGVPFFEVYRYSEYIHLGYLFSTRNRTGKFYESLISNIGRDISAKGIWLTDASRGGKCVNLSLSLQLFISKTEKQYKTYYETLGYEIASQDSKKLKDKLLYIIKTGKVLSVRKYLESIEEILDSFRKNSSGNLDQWKNFIVLTGLHKIIKDSCTDTSINFIDYLNELVIANKCLEVHTILISHRLYEKNVKNDTFENFIEFTYLLHESSYSDYIKTF
jgi:hypothetical protein